MKSNFKSFKYSEEIERLFQPKVKMGSSTPNDVEIMLDALELPHSPLVNIYAYKQSFPDFSFKYVISSSAPARPTMLIFANKWMIYFHFDEDKLLAKIDAKLFSDGL